MKPHLASILSVCALAGLLGISAAAAAPAISSTEPSRPELCAQWQHLQSETGTRFKNQGSCVAYLGTGGTLFSPTLDVIPRCFSTSTDLEITASGFHQASLATVTIDGATFLFGSGTEITVLTGTDETSVGIPGGFKIQPVLAPPVFFTTVVTITVRDAEGVNASFSTPIWCAPPPG